MVAAVSSARELTPTRREPTIAAGFARGLYDFARSRGADAGLLARAQISLDDVEDQDGRIPIVRYVALMRAAKAACADPAFALHFGAEAEIEEMSIVGLIAAASPTVAEGFAEINRYSRLIAEFETEGERFKFAREKDALWLVDTRINPNEAPELTEFTFAQMAGGGRRFGRGPAMIEVEATHPAPPYADEYERVLGAPVRFAAMQNRFRIPSAILEERVALHPRYVFGVLSERAQALLKALDEAGSARAEVERRLLPILHTGKAGMERVARAMGMSRQTLFRRLKAEETTFDAVLDDLRRRMALHYLSAKKVSASQTAYLVGFSDAAAFSRAFRRWTGMSPREARAGRALP
jgi:AraC-like DNA-binding protein